MNTPASNGRTKPLIALHPRRLLAAGAVALIAMRDTTPLLTSADLDAALTRWRSLGIEDYTIEIEKRIDGSANELLTTTVGTGGVTRFQVDGRAPERASDAYTVLGLFDIAERELEMAAATPQPGQPAGAVIKARFDERAACRSRSAASQPGEAAAFSSTSSGWRRPQGRRFSLLSRPLSNSSGRYSSPAVRGTLTIREP